MIYFLRPLAGLPIIDLGIFNGVYGWVWGAVKGYFVVRGWMGGSKVPYSIILLLSLIITIENRKDELIIKNNKKRSGISWCPTVGEEKS